MSKYAYYLLLTKSKQNMVIGIINMKKVNYRVIRQRLERFVNEKDEKNKDKL